MFPNRHREAHLLLIPLFLMSMLVCSLWFVDNLDQEEQFLTSSKHEIWPSVFYDQGDKITDLVSKTHGPLLSSAGTVPILEAQHRQSHQEHGLPVVDTEIVEAQSDLEEFPTMDVVATGYTAGVESTGKGPDHPQYGITYSGVDVRRDMFSTIAADPSVFPLGTVLYIPGYGYGVVADTGGAIKGNKIDLYFETVDDVYEQWGKKETPVYIIHEGDGRVTEAWLEDLNGQEEMASIPVDS